MARICLEVVTAKQAQRYHSAIASSSPRSKATVLVLGPESEGQQGFWYEISNALLRPAASHSAFSNQPMKHERELDPILTTP